MKKSMALILLASWAAAQGAVAETASKKAADPARGGQIATQQCAACHAADGNSAIPANPKLAGQPASYLAKQLNEFKSGERNSPIMMGIAASLQPQDIQDVSAYFAQQKAKPGTAKITAEEKARGQQIYRGGNPASGVSACMACHGPAGAGIPAQYPRVGGQHADYLLKELRAFKNGERKTDPAGMMQTIASKMTEQEMQAVAKYMSGLHD